MNKRPPNLARLIPVVDVRWYCWLCQRPLNRYSHWPCRGHRGGEPPTTPNLTTAHGVAQLQLFSSLAFKRRSKTWRDDEWHQWKARIVREAEEALRADQAAADEDKAAT